MVNLQSKATRDHEHRFDIAETKRTARRAGVAYLGLGISGMLAFLLVRSRLFEAGDAAATMSNLVANEGLARFGIAANLTVIVTQAVAALYFFKLFRRVDSFSAGALAAFGFMNSAAILVGTAFSATALQVAVGQTTDVNAAADALLLYDLEGAAWSVGALFFGLWLIPMGSLVLRSGFMPRPLGWILAAGGVGYLVSAYTTYLLPDVSVLAEVLTIPATVGELWMIGYLLTKGVHAGAVNDRP